MHENVYVSLVWLGYTLVSAFVNRYLCEFPSLSKLFELAILSLSATSLLSSTLYWERGRVSGKVGSLLGRLCGQLPVCQITHPIIMVKRRGDLQKDWVENRKSKWVEGEKDKTAKQTKMASFGTELGKGASTVYYACLSLSVSPPPPWVIFFVYWLVTAVAIFRITRTFPRYLTY